MFSLLKNFLFHIYPRCDYFSFKIVKTSEKWKTGTFRSQGAPEKHRFSNQRICRSQTQTLADLTYCVLLQKFCQQVDLLCFCPFSGLTNNSFWSVFLNDDSLGHSRIKLPKARVVRNLFRFRGNFAGRRKSSQRKFQD